MYYRVNHVLSCISYIILPSTIVCYRVLSCKSYIIVYIMLIVYIMCDLWDILRGRRSEPKVYPKDLGGSPLGAISKKSFRMGYAPGYAPYIVDLIICLAGYIVLASDLIRFAHGSRSIRDDFHNSHRQAPLAGPLLPPMTSQRVPFGPQ